MLYVGKNASDCSQGYSCLADYGVFTLAILSAKMQVIVAKASCLAPYGVFTLEILSSKMQVIVDKVVSVLVP
jgi:hypothetical protein